METDKFSQELSELCRKYKLKNCIFAGNDDDNNDKMIGLFCCESENGKTTLHNIISSSFNASRIYQAAREKILYLMDGK